MNMIFGIGIALLLIAQIFYPAIKFVDHVIFGQGIEARTQEWRLLAAKFALNEYMMIAGINELRSQMGLDPIPMQPIVERFNGIGPWATLKAKCRGIVNNGFRNITGIKLGV